MTNTLPYRRKEVIGAATLYLGDCLEIMPELEAADHIICDPPYEEIIHENNKKLANGGHLRDRKNPFVLWNFTSINEIRGPFVELAKKKSTGWFIAFCISEGVYLWEQAMTKSGIKYKRACLWIKPDGMPQFNGQCPGIGYECFVTGWAGKGHSYWNGGGKHGIYYCNKGGGDDKGITRLKNQ